VVEQRGEDQEPLGETFDLMIETKFREMFAELQGKLHRAKLAKKEMKKQLHNRGKQINNAQYGISMLLGQASVLENDDRLMRMYDDYQYMKSREENQKVFKETLNKKLSKGEGTSSSGIGEILSKLQRVESFEQDEERGVKESLRSLNRSRDLLITALKVIKETSLISAEDMKKPELSFDLDVENFEDSTQDTPLESNTTSFRRESIRDCIPRVGRTILDKRALEKALSHLKDGEDSSNTNFIDLSDSANNCRIIFPNEKPVKLQKKLIKKEEVDMVGAMEEAMSRFSIKERQAQVKHVRVNFDEDDDNEGDEQLHNRHLDPLQYEIVQIKQDEEEEEEEEDWASDKEWNAQRVSEGTSVRMLADKNCRG